MPLFELDEGRPRLVQPMQPLAGSFAQECAALLTHHLVAVAGEPLFVVRSRGAAPDHADLPELLALDATGRAVVVEVVQVVDDDAVVTALRHAGAASRLTTTDLTRAYHVDPGRFAVDYAAFREQVSYGTPASRREGVRLIVLCSEVAAEANDTLGFLRGPGRHVDVLQVGVVRGVDDSRLLDVSPLAVHEGMRRPVEPTALRLVRSSEAYATAMAYAPERDGGLPTTNVRKALTGELRAVTPAPARPTPPPPTPLPTPTPPAAPTPLPTALGRRTTTTEPTPVPTPAPPVPGTARTPPSQSTARPTSATFRPAPATLTPIAGLRAAVDDRVRPRPDGPAGGPVGFGGPAGVGGPRPFVGTRPSDNGADVPAGPVPAGPVPAGPVPAGPVPAGLVPAGPVPVAAVPAGPDPVLPETVPPEPTDADSAGAGPAGLEASGPGSPLGGGPGGPVPDARLATLAKTRRAVTTLVWIRERRGQRFVATLRPDGLLELSDGRVYADPNAAATAAADSESTLDGWRAWRLGDGGPTLTEAAERP